MRVLNPITSGPPHNAVTSARAARTRNAANLRRSCPAAQARAERGSSTALIFFDSRRAESSIRTPRSVCVPVGGAADAAAAPRRRGIIALACASGTRLGRARDEPVADDHLAARRSRSRSRLRLRSTTRCLRDARGDPRRRRRRVRPRRPPPEQVEHGCIRGLAVERAERRTRARARLVDALFYYHHNPGSG